METKFNLRVTTQKYFAHITRSNFKVKYANAFLKLKIEYEYETLKYGLIIIRLSQEQYLHTNKSTASDKTGETTGRGQDTQRRHTLLAILTGAEAFRVGWGRRGSDFGHQHDNHTEGGYPIKN